MSPRRRGRLAGAGLAWSGREPWAWLAPALAAASFLAAITALAHGTGLSLLLFPELGALASVVFRDPASPWVRSPLLLLLTPLLTAVLGVLLSSHLSYGPVAVTLAVAAGLLTLRGLRSPVAPALSAGYLPLALGIRSWTYPLAILIACLALVLLGRLWQRGLAALQAPAPPPASASLLAIAPAAATGDAAEPLPDHEATWPPPRRWLVPLSLFLAGSLLLGQGLGSHLVLAPPLLVIAWEGLAHGDRCPWQRRPLALLIACGTSSLLGLWLVAWLGTGALAAFLATLCCALLLDRLRLRCPPAFALALLPLVLPRPPAIYPLLVLVGLGWLLLVTLVAERYRRRLAGAGQIAQD